MADKENQTTPPSTEPGKDESKTYSGKFTSVEELSKGYGELEKTTAANNQRLAEFEKRLNDAEEATVQIEPEAETTAAAPTKTDYLARFYSDPEGLLGERLLTSRRLAVRSLANSAPLVTASYSPRWRRRSSASDMASALSSKT